MDNIQDMIKEISLSEEQHVIATITHVDGSAYRKEGTIMFFSESGKQMGMISGGCLEEDLQQKAMTLLANPHLRAQTTYYNMKSEDESGWGRGAGCNGAIHILIEKVDDVLQKHLKKINAHLNAGLAVTLIKEIIPIEGAHSEHDTTHVIVHTRLIPDASNIADIPLLHHSLSEKSRKKHQTIFSQTIRPKPKLFIFGAGIDVRPFALFSRQTGFDVTVWDWRPNLLRQDHFPKIRLVDEPSIKEAILKTRITSGDYVVIMTHDFQKDKEILQHMLQIESLRYLGVLGPRRRTKRLLQDQPKLKSRTFKRRTTIPDHLRSPVGLPIGADGPDEIAISILAELILTKQGNSAEKGSSNGSTSSNRHLFSSR